MRDKFNLRLCILPRSCCSLIPGLLPGLYTGVLRTYFESIFRDSCFFSQRKRSETIINLSPTKTWASTYVKYSRYKLLPGVCSHAVVERGQSTKKTEANRKRIWRKMTKRMDKKINVRVLEKVRGERRLTKMIEARRPKLIGHIVRHDGLRTNVFEWKKKPGRNLDNARENDILDKSIFVDDKLMTNQFMDCS